MNSDINTSARLFDLVRFQRMELLESELITSEEYDWLAHGCKLAKGQGSPSPRRLEDYDRIRERMDAMEAWIKIAAPVLSTAACIVVDDAIGRLGEIEGVRGILESCPVEFNIANAEVMYPETKP